MSCDSATDLKLFEASNSQDEGIGCDTEPRFLCQIAHANGMFEWLSAITS